MEQSVEGGPSSLEAYIERRQREYTERRRRRAEDEEALYRDIERQLGALTEEERAFVESLEYIRYDAANPGKPLPVGLAAGVFLERQVRRVSAFRRAPRARWRQVKSRPGEWDALCGAGGGCGKRLAQYKEGRVLLERGYKLHRDGRWRRSPKAVDRWLRSREDRVTDQDGRVIVVGRMDTAYVHHHSLPGDPPGAMPRPMLDLRRQNPNGALVVACPRKRVQLLCYSYPDLLVRPDS